MIDTNQVAIPNASTPFFFMPPGPASVVLSAAGTVYVGPGTAVTITNGFPVTSQPVIFQSYAGSTGGEVYAISSTGTVNASWLVSSGK